MQKQINHYKNLKIPAIILICLGIGTLSFAQPMEKAVTKVSFPVNIKGVAKDMERPVTIDLAPSSDSNKLTVNIENPNGKKLYLSLTGPSGETYTSDYINEKGYHKRFDFSKAEDGVYTLIVNERNRVKLIKQININTTRQEVTRKMEITDTDIE